MTTEMHQIGKYEIHEELGHGGFATVYKAIDTTLDRQVALKILHPSILRDPAFIDRFRQEARVMARLLHPNIATVFEIDEVDGRHFIAMQYIQGRNLHDLVREQRLLPFESVASIVEQIGLALDYAHAHGVIHRDVKPTNILVDERGHATLTDFGIAKAREGTSIQTSAGTVMGTPYYASPEQVESRPLDGRSDLYSLGIVAYELCTGNVPFKADSTPSVYYKIVHETPRLPSEANPRAARPIEQVLLKAIAKQPEQRYQSGQEFAAALRDALKQLDELSRSLYDAAVDMMNKRDLEGAKSKLKTLLALDPTHANAQALSEKISKLPTSQQRYREIVALVAQARTRAVELRRDEPNISDPDDVLRRLTEPASPSSTPVVPSTKKAASPRHRLRNATTALVVLGIVILVLAIYMLSSQEYLNVSSESERQNFYRQMYLGVIIGVGIGVVVSGLVCLAFSSRES